MSVKKILQNIERVLPNSSKLFFHEPCPSLYIKEYEELVQPFDEGFLTSIDLEKVLNFISDYNEYCFHRLGCQVIIYNVPRTSKLKYEDNFEEVTEEHIFDTLKEIDDSVKFVHTFSHDVYAVVCDKPDRIVQSLDGKLMGTNVLRVRLIQDTVKKFEIKEKEHVDDICTTSLIVAFFISIAGIIALHYLCS